MTTSRTALVLMGPFWPNLPPLGLACLKAYLKTNGIDSTCFDLNNDAHNGKGDMRKSVLKDFDVVGFSVYKTNFISSVELAKELKKIKPEIRIVFGGPEIARMYFDKGEGINADFNGIADCVIVGEGEKSLVGCVKKFYDTVGREQACLFPTAYNEINDLNELPIPDFSDFDLSAYPKKSAVSLMYSRGCVKKCSFCAERLLYKKFRTYPVKKVIEFISDNKKKGVNQFIFHDSLINGDLKALEMLVDGIIDRFGTGREQACLFPTNWEAQLAIRQDMPVELLKKMKQSGGYHFFVGLESGSASTLKRMNKGYTPHDALVFFKKMNDAGLSFGVSMITGFPGETEEDFKESLDFIVRNKALIPKVEQVNPFIFYDGIGIPKNQDYTVRHESLARAKEFIDTLKNEKIKHTKAFMLNLVDEKWK